MSFCYHFRKSINLHFLHVGFPYFNSMFPIDFVIFKVCFEVALMLCTFCEIVQETGTGTVIVAEIIDFAENTCAVENCECSPIWMMYPPVHRPSFWPPGRSMWTSSDEPVQKFLSLKSLHRKRSQQNDIWNEIVWNCSKDHFKSLIENTAHSNSSENFIANDFFGKQYKNYTLCSSHMNI